MTVNANQAKLGLLLPALLNPATAAAIGVGIIAVGLLNLLDDEQTDKPKLITGPTKATVKTEKPTVKETSPTVETQTVQAAETPQTPNATISDADQKEMIRKAMSELGKRSAAARAKKKAEKDELG